MKRSQTSGDNNDGPPWKEPKLFNSRYRDLKFRTADVRVTRSFVRKEVSVEEKNNEQELCVASVRKSDRLTSQNECKRKQQTCALKSMDDALLQNLSDSDLTGTLKILREARHGKCSFTQDTLDIALLSASRQGFLFVMQSLLYLGADIESSDADGNTALILSVERKSVEMVEFLLKKGADARVVRKSTGDSCLLLAVQPEGLFQIVNLLVDNGSNVRRENKKGDTALSLALEIGNVKVVHFLMTYGANADLRNKFGKTARDVANSVDLSHLLTSMSSLNEGVPALVKAVKMKDVQLLEILLDNKVENVNLLYWKNNVSMTALEVALEQMGARPDSATRETLEAMITLLLKEGASVNRNIVKSHAESAKSPLIIAATLGDCDLVDLLIRYGATKLSKGFEAALLAGNVDCAEFLLKRVAKNNFSTLAERVVSTRHVRSFRFLSDKCQVKATDSGLIHTAILGGHLNMVRLLVELGASIRSCGKCAVPLLHHAQDVAMASYLVAQGADMNATWVDYNSELGKFTALTHAIREDRPDLVKFYLSRGADVSVRSFNGGLLVLQTLSIHPSAEILDMLLAAGMDINHADSHGTNTLMWAIKEKKPQLLKLLIDKGADITLADGQGLSPLMHAVKSCVHTCKEAVECLINAGADVNRRDKNGNTALIHCFKSSSVYGAEKLKLLADAGASVNCQNDDGETALSVHMHSFSAPVTKALLELGADVNITDKSGNTPLLTLVSKTCVLSRENVQLFLDHGADVNFVNSKGKEPTTALSISFRRWMQERARPHFFLALNLQNNDGLACIVTSLLQAGADPNLAHASRFLMHWAIAFNLRDIIPTLVKSGLCPYECENKCIGAMFLLPKGPYTISLSPFKLALYLGRLSVAKFLADVSFFTDEDIGQGYKWANELQNHLRRKGYLRTSKYLNTFTSEPKSLIDLASLVISSSLEHPMGRKKAVASTGLPPLLQQRLLYLQTRGKLACEGDETLESEQFGLLSVPTNRDINEDADLGSSFEDESSSYYEGSDVDNELF